MTKNLNLKILKILTPTFIGINLENKQSTPTLVAKNSTFLGMSFYEIFIFGKIGLFQWPLTHPAGVAAS
ncbi:hypothetical protein PB01_02325 [Psychrobacillus glaciei]|uniref:Uncharacterized protein n=1 Tax=Psychrobacillus glaciei TaxID=2283160 RepID=A0A5J6SNF1_9BACI|nr:hypothetical protein PB01_02325 [Psychrobacillus glaciei]